MELVARTAPHATEHRRVERLADDQKRELRRGNPRILNHQFPALGKPGKCGREDVDRATWPGLVILARQVGKTSCLAQNQLAAVQQHGIHYRSDITPCQVEERCWNVGSLCD